MHSQGQSEDIFSSGTKVVTMLKNDKEFSVLFVHFVKIKMKLRLLFLFTLICVTCVFCMYDCMDFEI